MSTKFRCFYKRLLSIMGCRTAGCTALFLAVVLDFGAEAASLSSHNENLAQMQGAIDRLSGTNEWNMALVVDIAGSNSLFRSPHQFVLGSMKVGDLVWTNIGLRLKGKGSFQPLDRKPCLAIKWDEFVAGQQVQGFSKVFLHNGGRDASLMREFLSASILQEAGFPAARVSHARASINGRDLGFYSLIEAMNKPFLHRTFGDDSGNLYEGDLKDIDMTLEQDNGKVKDQADLQRLCTICRIPDPDERWRRLQEEIGRA